jgi:hypothetical protein
MNFLEEEKNPKIGKIKEILRREELILLVEYAISLII